MSRQKRQRTREWCRCRWGWAARLATVGLLAEQKDWDALPVGAAGVVLTVAVTASLVVLSHPFTVWLA